MKKMLRALKLSSLIQTVRCTSWLYSFLIVVTGLWATNTQGQTYCTEGLYYTGTYGGGSVSFNMESFEIGYQTIGLGNSAGTSAVDATGQFINLYEESSTYFFIAIAYTSDANFGIWIDFNDNGSFGDEGEFVSVDVIPYGTRKYVGTIAIPGGVPKGNHRMRVRMVISSGQSLSTSCAQYGSGQTIDYTVTILPSPPLIYSIQGTRSKFYGCTNTLITITGKYFANAINVYTHGVYSEIITKTDTKITAIINSDSYYQAAYAYVVVESDAGTSYQFPFGLIRSPT
ncbi:MAG: GEVED domain-containing protein, partial [Sediminibacterium sp.]